MPSRLSSLLVRDGLVGVKRMEKAFQRQVIYGGSLDTILLEMNLIPEDRLVQYLALASGLPPAARDEGEAITPEALGLIPRELAERYRAIPVALEGDAVRVLVCAPLEISELEDLADMLDRALQPLIAPEYRWNLVFAAVYELDPPARFTQLARMLDGDPSTPAVGRARSVIVARDAVALGVEGEADDDGDDEITHEIGYPGAGEPDDTDEIEVEVEAQGEAGEAGEDTVIEAPAPASAHSSAAVRAARLPGVTPDVDTLRFPGPSRRPAPEDTSRSRRHTMVGVAPNRARTDAMAASRVTPASMQAVPDQSGAVRAPGGRTAPRPPSAPFTTEGRDTPLTIVHAREQLAVAEDRDTVFLTLLRAARSRARWAGLLTIQGGAAIGRLALAEADLDARAITTVLIPLDVVSPFRNVVSTRQSHIGPLVSSDPGIDAMVARMGGAVPPSALILPIVLRDRVVAIVVAHRVHSDIRLPDVTELLPLATATSDALGRLIVKHKTAGYRAPAAPSIAELEEDAVVTKRLLRPISPEEAERWSAAPRPIAPDPGASLEIEAELSIEADPPVAIEDVLRAIEGSREGSAQAEDAITEAVERAAETVAALETRFPGRLRVDRFSVSGRALRPAQYGGLLELVVRLGGAAADLITRLLGSPQRDLRFYAAVCATELRPRNAVHVLAERLFDQDYGVRACAIEALSGYPPSDLEHAFTRARRALESNDPEIIGAAASAIVALGDVGAIEELIRVVERSGRGGEHARRALVALTAQDFGASERKWRKWWDGARRRHRIEWLIDGLGHKEGAIREAAIHDLRRLTGEYFGYHHDLPRRERDAAASRWAAWWRETGQRRFSPSAPSEPGEPSEPSESERHRPTAKIRPRTDDPA